MVKGPNCELALVVDQINRAKTDLKQLRAKRNRIFKRMLAAGVLQADIARQVGITESAVAQAVGKVPPRAKSGANGRGGNGA